MVTYFDLKLSTGSVSNDELVQEKAVTFLENLNKREQNVLITAATYCIGKNDSDYTIRIAMKMSGHFDEYQRLVDCYKALKPETDDAELNELLAEIRRNEQFYTECSLLDIHGSNSGRGIHPVEHTYPTINKTCREGKYDRIIFRNILKGTAYSYNDTEGRKLDLRLQEKVEINNDALKKFIESFEKLDLPQAYLSIKDEYRDSTKRSQIIPFECEFIKVKNSKVEVDFEYYMQNYHWKNGFNPGNPFKMDIYDNKVHAEAHRCAALLAPVQYHEIIVLDGDLECRYWDYRDGDIDNSTRVLLRQLQLIHAAAYYGKNITPAYSYWVKWDSIAIDHRTMDTLFNLCQDGMIIFECGGKKISLGMIENDEFAELLRKYQNSVQIVFICTPDEADEDPMEFPQEVVFALQEKNLDTFWLSDAIKDSELWQLEDFFDPTAKDSRAGFRKIKNYLKKEENENLTLQEILKKYEFEENLKKQYRKTLQLKEELGKKLAEQTGTERLRDEMLYASYNSWLKEQELQSFINKETIEKDWYEELTKFSTDFQPNLSAEIKYIRALNAGDARLDKQHIAICGNTGSGKTTIAKMIANYLCQEEMVPESKYIVRQATGLIAQYQGQTTAQVIEDFKNAKGHVMIIEGIDALLHQDDYGSQALDEIGIQMANCDKDTIVILTCEESSLMNLTSKFPDIGTNIGRIIRLQDYNLKIIREILDKKFADKGLFFDGKSDIPPAVVNAAFDKLEKDFHKSRAFGTYGLKFNLTSNIKFDDIIGNETAKYELLEIKEHLGKNDGYVIPKGILLTGDPGTGKTLLSKAFASEAGIPFCSVPVSYFTAPRADGAERVQTLFAEARKRGSCVIFIDEIESIVPSRRLTGHSSTMLSQLLAELDGFADNSGIIFLAATNHPEQIDEAILRAGRFDRKILVDLPNQDDRCELFKYYINKATQETLKQAPDRTYKNGKEAFEARFAEYVKLVAGGDTKGSANVNVGLLLRNGYFAEDVFNAIFENYCLMKAEPKDFDSISQPDEVKSAKHLMQIDDQITDDTYTLLAEKTTGCSGSAIKAIVDKAINIAISKDCPLSERCLLDSINFLANSSQIEIIMTDEEKERTAYHEAGHAIIAYHAYRKTEETVISRVSIIPHSDYLGITAINDPRIYTTEADLERELAILVAGRAAEELKYGGLKGISCGCASDMQRASQIVFEMLTKYGFNDTIGLLPFNNELCSDADKSLVYREGNKLLKDIYINVRDQLKAYNETLDVIADELISEQEISGRRFLELMREKEI